MSGSPPTRSGPPGSTSWPFLPVFARFAARILRFSPGPTGSSPPPRTRQVADLARSPEPGPDHPLRGFRADPARRNPRRAVSRTARDEPTDRHREVRRDSSYRETARSPDEKLWLVPARTTAAAIRSPPAEEGSISLA